MKDNKLSLHRCPFCGGEGLLKANPRVFRRDDGQAFKVECENRKDHKKCPVNMRTRYTLTVDEAVALWNTRQGE